jgi:cell shape-determining protein MreC
MPILDDQMLNILALILAFTMTLLALVSYNSYEKTKKRLGEVEAELLLVKQNAKEFMEKTTDAFADQKALKIRTETLETSLALAHEQLNKEREETERLRADYAKLRSEYEATKFNLTEAYRRIRENH